jgi:hypothetical protein
MLVGELPDYELKELETNAAKTSVSDTEQWFYMANNCAEEVARSPYPWIIFDVSLLSMCSKPSNASLNDLINNLRNAPAPTHTTAAVAGNTEKKNVRPFDWEELLTKIAKNDPQISDVLSKAKFTGLKQGKTILLDYSNTPELIGLNQDFFRSVEETVYELYGNLYRIEIVNSVVMQRVSNNDARKKALAEKEAVVDAQQILGAKIEKVNLF